MQYITVKLIRIGILPSVTAIVRTTKCSISTSQPSSEVWLMARDFNCHFTTWCHPSLRMKRAEVEYGMTARELLEILYASKLSFSRDTRCFHNVSVFISMWFWKVQGLSPGGNFFILVTVYLAKVEGLYHKKEFASIMLSTILSIAYHECLPLLCLSTHSCGNTH